MVLSDEQAYRVPSTILTHRTELQKGSNIGLEEESMINKINYERAFKRFLVICITCIMHDNARLYYKCHNTLFEHGETLQLKKTNHTN